MGWYLKILFHAMENASGNNNSFVFQTIELPKGHQGTSRNIEIDSLTFSEWTHCILMLTRDKIALLNCQNIIATFTQNKMNTFTIIVDVLTVADSAIFVGFIAKFSLTKKQ